MEFFAFLGFIGALIAVVGMVVLSIEAVTFLHSMFGPVGVGGGLTVIGLLMLGASYAMFLKMEKKS